MSDTVYHLGAALQGIADERADILTPRQTKALYLAASKLWGDDTTEPTPEMVKAGATVAELSSLPDSGPDGWEQYAKRIFEVMVAARQPIERGNCTREIV